MNQSARLEQMVEVLEDAAVGRKIRLPRREPDETTEDDVITSMHLHGMKPFEVLKYKNPWTRALRIMIKRSLDQQR